jgi:Mat/Ecp fimbriae major subunit
MKRTLFKLALLSTSILLATTTFADVTASATAKWDATAVKDTKSALVVTPIKSLSFQYAEGLQSFNTQNGIFDVTIQGQSGSTDFELTSQVISDTLSRSTDASTLQVGISWNGKKLSKNTTTTLINTNTGINVGLEGLSVASAYASSDRTSAQGTFVFSIDSATADGTTAAEYKDLADGMWNGEVAVQFTAVWTESPQPAPEA